MLVIKLFAACTWEQQTNCLQRNVETLFLLFFFVFFYGASKFYFVCCLLREAMLINISKKSQIRYRTHLYLEDISNLVSHRSQRSTNKSTIDTDAGMGWSSFLSNVHDQETCPVTCVVGDLLVSYVSSQNLSPYVFWVNNAETYI